MTREDVQNLLMMFEGFYSSFKPDRNFKTMLVNTWLQDMGEYDAKVVMDAFSAYRRSNTSGFAPTPAQLIEKIQLVNPPADIPTPLEAWSMVSKALRNSAYNSEQEFERLPSVVQKAAGSADNLKSWATAPDYNESVMSSQFMRDYRMIVGQAKEISKLPDGIRKEISGKTVAVKQIETNAQNVWDMISADDREAYRPKDRTVVSLPSDGYMRRKAEVFGMA